MPHTRFVLKKALEFGHAVVVVVNKIDSSSAHPEFSVYSTFELFIELNATDEQCDFQVIYASGIKGKDGLSPENLADDLGPLFESITRCYKYRVTGHKGRIAIGRLEAGVLVKGMEVKVGTTILNTVFDCYGPLAGDMSTRDLGSLVAFEGGTSTSYAMLNI
ncbi:putative elongation factor TypA SVR3, chloroplastic [Trifolium repens]|nr:putative elongation factor TypA SVR3, chloroplastic [Trifolium repens]